MAFCLIGVYCKVLNFIPYWLVLVEFFVLATQLVQVIPCSVFPKTLALRFLIAVSAKIFVCHEMSFKTTTMSPAISCLSHCTTSCSAPLSTSLFQCFICLPLCLNVLFFSNKAAIFRRSYSQFFY